MSNDHGTLVERVAEEIRSAILSGTLEPGQKIAQKALAEKYGTSRLPVREALRLLQNEGLVSVRANAGARVAGLTMDELTEVYLMRERLEPQALAASIPHLSDEEIATIREKFDAMDELAEAGDQAGWLEVDRQFHGASLAAAPMPQLLRTISGLWNVATRYRRAYAAVWFDADRELQRAEHLLLLTAIERRTPEDAEMVLTMHIRRTRLGLEAHQEVFDR
jgi:DNA-binding GntR family transcriptional regulator